MTSSDKSKQAAHSAAGKPEVSKGIELDEDRPFGSSGAWAPQGGQHLGVPERNPDGSPRAAPDEPDHVGNTQSTTNSQ
ncbi:hypothetical protein [Schlesneria paludicola]|uniref:hypothetical protein n=1 Tax=Schlesneria paludicola TaxID=360056 RepID=UPI00029A16B9|nr:hypothetical protein [Schlesneria paludicola]